MVVGGFFIAGAIPAISFSVSVGSAHLTEEAVPARADTGSNKDERKIEESGGHPSSL
jgi:hypothetical protein